MHCTLFKYIFGSLPLWSKTLGLEQKKNDIHFVTRLKVNARSRKDAFQNVSFKCFFISKQHFFRFQHVKGFSILTCQREQNWPNFEPIFVQVIG